MRAWRGAWLLSAGLLALLAWRLETPWRKVQAAYFDQLAEHTRAELAVLRTQRADDLRFLTNEVEVARDQLATRAGEVAEAERRVLDLDRKLRRAEARREREAFSEQVELQRQLLDELTAEVRAAERELARARAPIDDLAARVEALGGLRAWLRRVPVARALGAGMGRRQLAPALTSEAGSPANLERCVTCHLSAMADESPVLPAPAETWARLWAPHPSPDLYLADASPHPIAEFGCTSCHGGDGLATGFVAAGHVPLDDQTAARWRRDWGWRKAVPSQAPRPIRAGVWVESSCVECHDAPWLRGAPIQEAGRALTRAMACAACHETGRPDLQPSVPSLAQLTLHKRPEWVAAFLAEPSAWKPTFMPHFWSDAEAQERDAEIAAVVARLGYGVEPPDGSTVDTSRAREGRDLFRTLACGACHLIEAGIERAQLLGSARLRGPSLASIGSQVRSGALEGLLSRHQPAIAWQSGEVTALAAFLGTKTSSRVPSVPTVDTAVRDRLLKRRLLAVTTEEDADARMARLGDDARELLLGELAVRRYRCAACHQLPPTPIGLDLPAQDSWSAKASSLADIGRSAFDARDRRHPRPAGWPHANVASDEAAESDATLPDWRLAAAESEALAVQLAGWVRSGGGLPGRDVMARAGCVACHDLDGRGPPSFFASRTVGRGVPPSLARAGEKLRTEWIFRLLGEPTDTALRSFTGLRMPRFDLTDGERSEVAEYFAAQSGQPVLTPEPPASSPAERALGAAVFEILFCDSCHGTPAIVTDRLRAPAYVHSGERLRGDWLRRWLIDPQAWDERPSMPPPFPLRDGEPDASYLLAILDAPMFELQRRRLERFFAGRNEFSTALGDTQRVADALAAYVLSLEE